MEKKYVAWRNGRVDVYAMPAVSVEKDEALVKPLHVMLSDIEKHLFMGLFTSKTPVIIGSTGVVKIIESSNGEQKSGRSLLVKPFGANGLLGVDADGLLSSYTGLHKSYFVTEVLEPRPHDALKPLLTHASLISSRVEADLAVVEGCGFLALATALALILRGVDPVVFCRDPPKEFYYAGIKVAKHANELPGDPVPIVATTPDANMVYKAVEKVRPGRIVASIVAKLNWVPVLTNRLEVIVENDFSPIGDNVVELTHKLLKSTRRYVRFEKVASIEDVLGLLPFTDLGLVVSFE